MDRPHAQGGGPGHAVPEHDVPCARWTSAPPARPGGSIPTRRAGWSSSCSARSEHVARPSLQTEPRPTRTMALTACACWERSIGWPSASSVFKCCKVTAAPAKPSTKARSMALSRSEPPRSLSISATRRSNAVVALVRASSSRHVSSCRGLPCASGDELVSLGFRVGNPSAIGWYRG